MRSYCAVYVDVGYLLASAATRVTGSSLRSGIEVDYPGLIAGMIEQVERDSGLPLLRVNWYDSGSRQGGQPDYHQDQIGLLPRIKLRLGRLSYAGEQKGVDVRLGLDLALQGRARVADVVYLVSGDDDLTEAVEEAQGSGVQVVLLSVPGQNGHGHAVSKHLRRAADGELTIDAEVVDRCVRSRALAEGLLPKRDPENFEETENTEDTETTGDGEDPENAREAGDAGDAGGAEQSAGTEDALAGEGTCDVAAASDVDAAVGQPSATADSAGHPVPDEAVGAEPPSVAEQLSETTPGLPPEAEPESTPVPDTMPTPAVFGRRRATEVVLPGAGDDTTPTWTTSTGDEPIVDDDGVFNHEIIDSVAKALVASWCRTATPDDLVNLRASKPTIPGELDRALLLDLSGRAGVYEIDDASRHTLRDRFWFHVGRVRLT